MLKKFSDQIIFFTFAPLILQALIVIIAELIFYFQRNQLFDLIRNEVFQQQKQQLLSIESALSSQILSKFQYSVLQVMVAGRFGELQLFEGVPLNPGFQFAPANNELLYFNNENSSVQELYQRNQAWLDGWYFKNSTNYTQLSAAQQTYIRNVTCYGAIKRAIQLANTNNARNLRFLSFSNVDFGSGTAIFTPPLNVTFTKCQQQPVPWLPAEDCRPGTVAPYDHRCQPYVYLEINASLPGGIHTIPVAPITVLNDLTLFQIVNYKQLAPVSDSSGVYQGYRVDAAPIQIEELQSKLYYYSERYDFLLFQSTTNYMVYYKSISNQNYSQIPTLQSAWLNQMSQDQQQVFLSAIPSNWSIFKYQENVTVVPKQLSSISNQIQDKNIVEVEYQIGGDTYISIMQLLQVYAKSRTTSSIDNFYVLSANFNKNQIVEVITCIEHLINVIASYSLGVGVFIMVVALTCSFLFARRFARTIDEPIGKLANLLAVIDSSYFQDIEIMSQEQIDSERDNINVDTRFQSQKLGKNLNSDTNQIIQNKLDKILHNLVTNKDIGVLHESLTYVFKLIKFANQDFWSGSQDTALLKMIEAKQVYTNLGNISAQSSTSFNIGNIHFNRQFWEEAILAYTESLNLIDKQLEELKQSQALTLKESQQSSPGQQNKIIQGFKYIARRIKRVKSNYIQENILISNQNLKKFQSQELYVQKEQQIKNQNIRQQRSKINSLLQKKFDRLYYILLAHVNRARDNETSRQLDIIRSKELLEMIQLVLNQMGSTCNCLKFIQVYQKTIVAIYSENYDQAEYLIYNELRKNKLVTQLKDNQPTTMLSGSTSSKQQLTNQLCDDKEQFVKRLILNKNSSEQTCFEKQCRSKYYHAPPEIYEQKVVYLESLLLYKQNKSYIAMTKILDWLNSTETCDRHHFQLIEQLAKKIVKNQSFTFSDGGIKKKVTQIGILFDGSESVSLIQQQMDQVQSCIRKYLMNQTQKMTICLSQSDENEILTIVQGQTADWLLHHWPQVQQYIKNQKMKQLNNFESNLSKNISKMLILLKKESRCSLKKYKSVLIVASQQKPDTNLEKLRFILKKINTKLIYYYTDLIYQSNYHYNNNCQISIVGTIDQLQHELQILLETKKIEHPILIESL